MQRMKKAFTCFALLAFVLVHHAFSQNEDSVSTESSVTPVSSPADSLSNMSVNDSGDSEASQTAAPSAAPAAVNPTPVDSPVVQEQPASAPTVSAPPASAAQPQEEVAKTSTTPAPASQPQASSSEDNDFFLKGIGIQSGVRFHDPDVFNEFVTDVWNTYIEDFVYLPVDKKYIGPGVFMTLNGSLDFGKYFQVTPFMQGMWAGKWFYFRGGVNKDLYVNTYTAMGGLNVWGRLPLHNRFAVRLGAGGYGAYTVVKFTGDIKTQRVKGRGYGFRGLLGSELRLNRHFILTLDLSMPFGVTTFRDKGSLKTTESSVAYPKKMEHSGFEIIPGALFYF